MHRVQTVSHIVFATPAETFVAIQDDLGRMPITDLNRKGSCIEWLRADGGIEAIDLTGSPSEAVVLQNFDSDQGLLVAIYPDLSAATSKMTDPQYLVVSSAGVIEGDLTPGATSERGKS